MQKITNKFLLAEIAKSRKINKPTNKLGKAFVDMATQILKKPNFCGFNCRDELVTSAVEHLIATWKNFDSTKSQNPFAYFHQVIGCGILCELSRLKRVREDALNTRMKILAVDQSYTHCAYVVTQGKNILDFDVLVSDTTTDVYKRSLDLSLRLGQVFLKHRPEQIRLEGLAFGMRGNVTRDLAGLLFTIINVISHLHVFNNFKIVPPTQVKKTGTGSGKAKKKEMIAALPADVKKLFTDKNYKLTTGLSDLADSYWLSQTII